MEMQVNLTNEKREAQKFLELIETAEKYIVQAQNIGWKLIRANKGSENEEDNRIARLGWAMQAIAQDIENYITNFAGDAEDWDLVEKTANE